MEDCIFCKIIKKELPSYTVYEDNDFVAFLDINPINLGHTLIAPKEHVRNIFEMPDELMSKLGPLLKNMAIAVKKSVSADGVNIAWNNERASGQIVFHSHTHVIPRFTGDGHGVWHGKDGFKKEEFEKVKRNIEKNFNVS